jgi:hypothetical protein
VAAGTVGLALAFVLAIFGGGDRPVVSWLAVSGTSAAMAGALAAGAVKGERLSRWALVAVLVVLFVPLVGLGAALLLPASGAAEPLLLGLPLRAAIVVYGVGFLPVLILPACFALDFDASEGD